MRGQGSQANGPNKDQLNDHEDFSSWRNQSIQVRNRLIPSCPFSLANRATFFQSAQNSYVSGVAPSSSDPYLSSYYGTSSSSTTTSYPPYQLDHAGPWSSSPAQPAEMAYLSSYGHHHHDSYGMFGPPHAPAGGFGFHAQPPSFGYDSYAPSSSAWDSRAAAAAAAAAKVQQPPPVSHHYDDYYQHHSVYQPASRQLDDSSSSMAQQQQQQQQTGVTSGMKQVEQGMHGLAIQEAVQAAPVPQPSQPSQPAEPKKLTWASIASQPAKPQLAGAKKKSMVPPPMVTPRTPATTATSAPVSAPPPPTNPQMDIGTWASNGTTASQPMMPAQQPTPPPAAPPVQQAPVRPAVTTPPKAVQQQQQKQPSPVPVAASPPTPPPASAPANPPAPVPAGTANNNPILEELQSKHTYNPKEFDAAATAAARNARFFVIKSYSEDDIHRSIKYEIWCSTEHGNKRLDSAFRER